MDVMCLKKLFILVISIIMAFSSVNPKSIFADEIDEGAYYIDAFNGENVETASVKGIQINAGAAIVMDMKSGRVLFEKNAYTKRSIASTTKIMTAIIAIENGTLEDIVTVSERSAGIWGSTIGLETGETFKLSELLYALMLKSGNDAAIAIAEHIGGTVEGFAEMMNRKAAELGAKNTSFRTPHGLDMPDHYSTAYDLALITKYALANPTFSKIVGTQSAYFDGRAINNTNELLMGGYTGADGVKTGYTGQAGRCLVTSATKGNWRIISVVLGCPTRTARATSSRTILDYAFKNYKPYTLVKSRQNMASLNVIKGRQPSVAIIAENQISLPLSNDEINAIQTVVDLPDTLPAPVKAGDKVGNVTYLLNGKVLVQTALEAVKDVHRKNIIDYMGQILKTWVSTARYGIFP